MHFCNNPSCHNPLHCFLPPYVIDRLTESEDPEIRRLGIDAMASAAATRAVRSTLAMMPMMAAIPSPAGTKHRLVYDMKTRRSPLPGKLIRSEGDAAVADKAINEAYDHAGITYDFYKDIFDRNSLDNRGMSLISSVHYGRKENNAFWTGEQMLYGDGDGRIFVRFTKALDVVAHELTHGVISFTSDLKYEDEPGALNEHFADAFGAMVKQWYLKQDVNAANWLNGDTIMGPAVTAKCIRTFKEGKAYENDPLLGTDPQPKHMRDKYLGTDDSGGVHINSGIPNHAFYRVAIEIGGNSWDKTGKIWYQTLKNLNSQSQFQEAASMTHMVAGSMFGAGSLEQNAVKTGWSAVGITV